MSRRKVRLEAGNYILIGDTGSHYSIMVPKEMTQVIEQEERPVDEIQTEAGMEFAMPDYIGESVERANEIPISIPPVEPSAELLRQMEQLRADIDRIAGNEINDDSIDALRGLVEQAYPEMIQREQDRLDAMTRERIQGNMNEQIARGRMNLISTPQHDDTHLQQMMRSQTELNEAYQQVVQNAAFHGGAIRRGPIQAEEMPDARYRQEYQQRPQSNQEAFDQAREQAHRAMRPQSIIVDDLENDIRAAEGNFNTDRSTNIELKKRKMAQAKAGETSED